MIFLYILAAVVVILVIMGIRLPKPDPNGRWVVRHERIRAGTATYSDYGPFSTKRKAIKYGRRFLRPYDAVWIFCIDDMPGKKMPPLPDTVHQNVFFLTTQTGMPVRHDKENVDEHQLP